MQMAAMVLGGILLLIILAGFFRSLWRQPSSERIGGEGPIVGEQPPEDRGGVDHGGGHPG
jgi:hypothetical protein